jgi:hypothetical protein
MVRCTVAITTVLVALLLSACEFKEQADQAFGDQHFKTAIALVELHKVRTGSYPETLKELKFTNDGYTLEITRGWVGKPQLKFPPEFYAGLGLRRTAADASH